MFDLSFPELSVVALLALLVFGPQELGRIMYGLGRVVRRLQYLRFALSQQFEDFMQKAGEADLTSQVNFETHRKPPPVPAESPEQGEAMKKKDGNEGNPSENASDKVTAKGAEEAL